MKLFNFQKRIYLDYASLTPIDPRVMREMRKFSSTKYVNPSSLYKEGVLAKNALADGRHKVAEYLHAHPDEIVFTSGGTETNNLAIVGVVKAYVKAIHDLRFTNKETPEPLNRGDIQPHIIISSIEHSSIIEIANEFEKQGCEVTRLAVDKNGIISLNELKKSIKENTVLVSVMMVNNEIGTIQPIKEIAKIVRDARKRFTIDDSRISVYPLLHTDAAQAMYQEINMEKMGIDLLTLDGGKVYGPRGIGALYVRRGTPISSIVFGGGQENGLRSGTENMPAIMGFAKALEILNRDLRLKIRDLKSNEVDRIFELRNFFIQGLKQIRGDISFNGIVNSSPHILNISIPGIDNEFFLFELDAHGIACSTKSSCLRDEEESYVLKAIGANSKNSLRFSFGRWTKKGDIRKALAVISLFC